MFTVKLAGRTRTLAGGATAFTGAATAALAVRGVILAGGPVGLAVGTGRGVTTLGVVSLFLALVSTAFPLDSFFTPFAFASFSTTTTAAAAATAFSFFSTFSFSTAFSLVFIVAVGSSFTATFPSLPSFLIESRIDSLVTSEANDFPSFGNKLSIVVPVTPALGVNTDNTGSTGTLASFNDSAARATSFDGIFSFSAVLVSGEEGGRGGVSVRKGKKKEGSVRRRESRREGGKEGRKEEKKVEEKVTKKVRKEREGSKKDKGRNARHEK